MRRHSLAAVLAAAAIGLGGCSGDTSAPAVSDVAARQLQSDVLAVTTSAAAHNWPTAKTQLQTLRTHLAAARSAGTVAAARATSIDAAIAVVSSDLVAASAQTTTPPTRTAPAATTAAPKPSKGKKHGGDNGGDGGGGGGG